MLNDTYVQQVENKYGNWTASTVFEAIEKAEEFLNSGKDYSVASAGIEQDLILQEVSEEIIRLSLIAMHAVYYGWDDAFDFFLEKNDFELATDGQAELIQWVSEGNWLK